MVPYVNVVQDVMPHACHPFIQALQKSLAFILFLYTLLRAIPIELGTQGSQMLSIYKL